MSIHRLRLWLPILAVAMLACSFALLAWAVLAPSEVNNRQVRTSPRRNVELGAPDQADAPSWKDFEPLFGRRFQRPLFDPPPEAPPAPVVKVTPPPPVKLVATMPEPDGGHAMFSDPRGAILIKSVGDEITGGDTPAVVTEIAEDHVVLRHEGRLVTLKLNPE